MDILSWTEVDDLRGRLGAADRDRFDAELRALATGPDGDAPRALEELLVHWRGMARPARTASFRLGFAPGWFHRLTTAAH